MDKNRLMFCSKARIIMAKELDVPPDDINIFAIFDCVERAIQRNVEKDMLKQSPVDFKPQKKQIEGETYIEEETYILLPRNENETSSVVGECGEKIVRKIFCREYPFYDWVDIYENWYRENMIFEFIKRKLKMEEGDGNN